MESGHTTIKKTGMLYPTMLVAAIAVIIFSVIGIATMTGHMPSALSKSESNAVEDEAADRNQSATRPAATSATPSAHTNAACAECGVVESIQAVQSKGQGSGLGAVAGGVIGGILGNQVGRGGGRTAMTLVGAGAGALTGNEIEKNMNKAMSYRIRVRMNDGTLRTFYERSQPAFGVGQKVRATNKGIVTAD